MRSKLARYMINLEHFATVVEYGTISGAASVLAITQSALTRSILRLEKVLEVQLLHRSARGVSPTLCGSALLKYIAAADVELDRAQATIGAMKNAGEGRINCGAPSFMMNYIIPTAVSAMLRAHQKIHVNLVEDQTQKLLLKLRSGELDIVLGLEQPDSLYRDFRTEPLIEEHYNFRARSDNALLGGRRTLKQVFEQDKLVLPPLDGIVGKSLEAELERLVTSRPEFPVETSSSTVMRHLVLHDGYIALCSSVVFGPELRSGTMQTLEGDWNAPLFRTSIFLRRESIPSAKLERFVHELKVAAATGEMASAA